MEQTTESPQNSRALDNKFFDEHQNEIIFTRQPEDGKGAAREGYYWAENVELMVEGVTQHLDIYFVDSMVVGLDKSMDTKVHPTEELVEAGYSNMTNRQLLQEGFTQYNRTIHLARHNIERLSRSAEKDKTTQEAYELMQNVARAGKRIALVASHGYPITENGKTEWVLQSHSKKGHSSPDEVVQDLLSKTDENGDSQYGLVYLIGCNPDNAHVDKGQYTQPVIVHTKNNEATSAPAKII